jgi:hypothetical protein
MSPLTLDEAPPRPETCAACRRPVRWAVTAANHKPIPLDPDPVGAGQRGALVLIGEVAHGRRDAVRRLVEMFGGTEADADRRAVTDYGWFVAHFATCPERRTR